MFDEKIACMCHLYGMVEIMERVSSAVVSLLYDYQKLVEGFSFYLIIFSEIGELEK